MNIYLDMDDVVADWMPAARAIVNRNWEYGERIPESDWSKVKAKQRFYRDLPVKPGAYELVDYCKQLVENGQAEGLYFLTALPHDHSVPYASQDKVLANCGHIATIITAAPKTDSNSKLGTARLGDNVGASPYEGIIITASGNVNAA